MPTLANAFRSKLACIPVVLALSLALSLLPSCADAQTVKSIDLLTKPQPDKERTTFVVLIGGKGFGTSLADVTLSVEPTEGILAPLSVISVSRGTMIVARFEARPDYAPRRVTVKVGNKESNTFEIVTPEPAESEGSNVHVFRSILDPKNVSDIFGRRIGKRFVAIQVTVTNRSKDFNYLIHDVSLVFKQGLTPEELGMLSNLLDQLLAKQGVQAAEAKQRAEELIDKLSKLLAKRPTTPEHEKEYELSSVELSILRGVAEKGQVLDRRNLTLRALRGVGTIAAGLIGVATFGSSYAPSVATFNGPVITAFSSTFPDLTINQLTRLNDSAYMTNTVIPRQQAKVLVVFIPQAIFLTTDQRKAFWDDPAAFFADNPTSDLRRLEVAVDGNLITEVEELPPAIAQAVIEEGEQAKFHSGGNEVHGYILGRFLTGARVEMVSTEPTGLKIASATVTSDKRLDFTLKVEQPVPLGTPLTLKVWKEAGSQTTSIRVGYAPKIPRIERVEVDPGQAKSFALANGRVSGRLKGSNLDVGTLSISGGPEDLAIEPRPEGSSATELNFVIKVKTPVPAETTLTIKLTTVNNISSHADIKTPTAQ